jgi:hypothetical protein
MTQASGDTVMLRAEQVLVLTPRVESYPFLYIMVVTGGVFDVFTNSRVKEMVESGHCDMRNTQEMLLRKK